MAVGTLAVEHSKVRGRACCSSGIMLAACHGAPGAPCAPLVRCCCSCHQQPYPCLLRRPQVRALAKDMGFLSLADSLKAQGSGKVAEAAAEVAAKLRL